MAAKGGVNGVQVLEGDCLEGMATLPAGSVHCCVTSPPYWGLRDYGHGDQLGQEKTPQAYVANMVKVFEGVRRVLRPDGTLWLNLGDTYADKNAAGIPWRVAFALQEAGWYLRQDIIWDKPNPMPESCRDRCVKAHEYIFLLTKQPAYYFDYIAIQEPPATPGRVQKTYKRPNHKDMAKGPMSRGQEGFNHQFEDTGRVWSDGGPKRRRSVWHLPLEPYKGGHFAAFPSKLARLCLLAGTSGRGCCPACGAPWRRLTSKRRQPTRPGTGSKVYETPPVHPDSPVQRHSGDVCGNRDPQRHTTIEETVGWEAACSCGRDDVQPCVVLDPFAGSGTTLAAAVRHGRWAVGCELNPEYVKLIRERVRRAISKRGFGLI